MYSWLIVGAITILFHKESDQQNSKKIYAKELFRKSKIAERLINKGGVTSTFTLLGYSTTRVIINVQIIENVKELKRRTSVPVLLKGILQPEDGKLAF